MNTEFLQRVDRFFRGLTPFVLTMGLVMLGAVPLHIPGLAQIAPVYALAAVFYWTIYRPDLWPYAASFLIGLLQDALGGTPFGLTSLILLAVHAVVASQRRFFWSKTFIVVWLGFVLVAFAAAAATWIVASLYFATIVAAGPAVFQILLTVAAYPCLAWLFGRTHQSLVVS